MGETAENLSRGLDTYSYRQPLGVTAGICPFNFPAMIPLWMFPVSTGCGNTMILKPSEKDPGASMLLAQLARQAGLPDGVLQVLLAVHCLYGVIKSKCSLRSLYYRCHDIPSHPRWCTAARIRSTSSATHPVCEPSPSWAETGPGSTYSTEVGGLTLLGQIDVIMLLS